ncbi:MAG TPA: 16S rRNA (guanine(966)-N(2))-methyltransferase RsmD [Chloroflexota bacterium]|nr:16S rRNA (guanine(966)-N(2))-methyltransferase RsmD [Chloroflexota bacterium]
MRVIAGEARGVPLIAPRGLETRPTSDKVKGAIFDSLGDAGSSGRVLDLFAGSGALGIEALSRGADHCDFVDRAAAACKTIATNLAKTRMTDRAAIHATPVDRFLDRAGAAYDLILMDPPYALAGLDRFVTQIAASPLAGPGTVLVVEHSSRRVPPPGAGCLALTKTRVHGDTAFSVYAAPHS